LNDGIRILSAAQFDDRGVLVTGGASGIGRAIAQEFCARGARVLVADRDRDGLARLPALLDPADRLLTIEADLAEPDTPGWLGAEAERLLGGVDVLVNNAGLMRQTPALEITVTEWDELFAVNLRAVFFLTQAVAGAMAERGGGAVVSIASVNAFRAEAPEVHYNATKAGIVSVMRSFTIELAHRGVRFNCVAPGETVAAEEAAAYTDDDRERTRRYLQRVPLRRVGLPAEMARAVCFLASDEASYVSGQTIVVDGGELSGDWYDTASRPPVPEHLAGIDPEPPR
jgi:NAD(P)-dependent dehydrogenase (short-subunit alcohol dehydrogenase family)